MRWFRCTIIDYVPFDIDLYGAVNFMVPLFLEISMIFSLFDTQFCWGSVFGSLTQEEVYKK